MLVYLLVGSIFFGFIFLMLWLKERRNAQKEYIAYGLRSSEDGDENTKTNITAMESGFREAMSKLEDLGEVACDQWGQWKWTKTGKPVGQILGKQQSGSNTKY